VTLVAPGLLVSVKSASGERGRVPVSVQTLCRSTSRARQRAVERMLLGPGEAFRRGARDSARHDLARRRSARCAGRIAAVDRLLPGLGHGLDTGAELPPQANPLSLAGFDG
jgi:hypothetical protein